MTSPSEDRLFGANSSMAIKVPCRVATTADITLSGLQTVDGVTVVANDRVLVKDQADGTENGIYLASTSSWQRAPDFNGARDVCQGTLVMVTQGSTLADTVWRIATSGTITPGTTSITFENAMFSDAESIAFLQAGTGAVERTVRSKLRETVSVKDFGAVGDGATDDLAALDLAAAAAKAAGVPLIFPATPDGYAISATWNVPNDTSVIMEPGAFILYTGSADEIAVVVGDATALTLQKQITLDVRRDTVSDWSSESNIGIRLRDLANCYGRLSAQGFTIGIQCYADDGERFAYNNFDLNYIIGNKYGVDLHSAAGGNGFLNENNFNGGRIGYFSGSNTGEDRYGVRFSRGAGGYASHNNNRFWGTNIEIGQVDAGAGEAIPVLAEVGYQNQFYSMRTEGNDATYLAREGVGCGGQNTYDIGYSDANTGLAIDHANINRGSIVRTADKKIKQQARTIWNSGHIPSRTAVYYDGANYHYSIMGMHVGASSSAMPEVTTASVNPLTADYFEVPTSRSIGVLLNTQQCKEFVVRRECEAGQIGRVAFRCYDNHPNAGGAVITGSAGVADDNVRLMNSTSSYGYSTVWGGCYVAPADNADDVAVAFGPNVKFVAVLIVPGTNRPFISSLEIAAIGDYASAVEPGHNLNPFTQYLSAAPNTGTYARGLTVYDSTPTAGSPLGWVCTVAGTPGTWVDLANV